MPLRTNLRAVRTRLGLSQQELASAAGITRQTVGGLESGDYAPSAVVALRLARALGCTVEELFALDEPDSEFGVAGGGRTIRAYPSAPMNGGRVALAAVGGRWIAHPLTGEAAFRDEMVPADGIASVADDGAERPDTGTVAVRLLDDPNALAGVAFVAGCAPSLTLWARSAERWHPSAAGSGASTPLPRVHCLHANSSRALELLARGEVHAAGVHFSDGESDPSGDANAAAARAALAGEEIALVTLGIWDEGLLAAPDNPKGLGSDGASLVRSDITLINREIGAGARSLLDDLLERAGIPSEAVRGYGAAPAQGHVAVGRAIASGAADVGVGVESVASAFGLHFIPLRRVRYDLALRRSLLDQPPLSDLVSTLSHRWVRAQLAVTGGYDTSRTGEVRSVLSRE